MNPITSSLSHRVPCSTCKRVASAIAELQLDDLDRDKFPRFGRSIDIATLDTFRNAKQCSTCAKAYVCFLQGAFEDSRSGWPKKDDGGSMVYVRADLGYFRFRVRFSVSSFNVSN
jgi:hypothetical protein